jgi:TetR/AcrR family transcriptional regulator, regulator of biofilm formation and stress response
MNLLRGTAATFAERGSAASSEQPTSVTFVQFYFRLSKMQVSEASKQLPDETANRPLSKGEQCRLILLDAALRVIAKGGVEAVTHRSVAAEAEVSRGTTTYHFESRNEIVLCAFRHYIGTVNARLSTNFEALTSVGQESIIEFLVRFQQREFLDPELIMAEYELILYAARNEALGREYRAWSQSLVEHFAPVLETAGAAEPIETAKLVLGLFRAFELECLTHRETRPEALRTRLELVLPALLGAGTR